MYMKELKTRIRKDRQVSLVDQKAWQPSAVLNIDAKETFCQLQPQKASLKLRKTI